MFLGAISRIYHPLPVGTRLVPLHDFGVLNGTVVFNQKRGSVSTPFGAEKSVDELPWLDIKPKRFISKLEHPLSHAHPLGKPLKFDVVSLRLTVLLTLHRLVQNYRCVKARLT